MLYGSDVKEVFGLPSKGPHRDAVGIEIEMELNTRIPSNPLLQEMTTAWNIKSDGSLRNHGYEFVSDPTPIKNLSSLLGDWDKVLGSPLLADRIEDCPRASVHVHVNVRDYTYNQLMNIITAYTLLEGVLVAYCGKYRFGNLFALRIPEASSNFRNVLSRVREYAPFKLNSDHRYGALNLCSVGRFGTIEFRSLGSVYDPAAIDLWVSGLHYMAQHAATHYKRPPDVYARYAEMDRRSFLEEFLGPLAKPLMAKVTSIDSLFEDGEEYVIRLLSAHPDNWTYEKDFRDNPEFIKACKENYGYRKNQILQLTLSNARGMLRDAKERALSIGREGADFTDWVPAVDASEAPRNRPNRDTHYINWVGDLPENAFREADFFRTYTNWVASDGEEFARRASWDAEFLDSTWVARFAMPLSRSRRSRSAGLGANTVSVDPTSRSLFNVNTGSVNFANLSSLSGSTVGLSPRAQWASLTEETDVPEFIPNPDPDSDEEEF